MNRQCAFKLMAMLNTSRPQKCLREDVLDGGFLKAGREGGERSVILNKL